MFNFLLGLAIGWLAGNWYSNSGRPPIHVDDFRRKASTAIEESQRLVDESKRELQAVVEGTGGERNRRGRRRQQHPDE